MQYSTKYLMRPPLTAALLSIASCSNSSNGSSSDSSPAKAESVQPADRQTADTTVTPPGARGDYTAFQLSDEEFERRLTKEYSRCMDLSGGVTINIRACSAQESELQDQRLNAVYKVTMARLPSDEARAALRASQRNWLKTRYVHCDEELAAAGEHGPDAGTIAPIILDACGLKEDIRRTAWLERYR